MTKTKQPTVLNSTTPPASRIGGSILPSSDPTILQPLNGLHGVLQVRPMPEAGTYGLFFTHSGGTGCLAQHANGYSCRNLAVRLVDVWAGKREPAYALAQFDYILNCGGLGKSRESFSYIATGFPEDSGAHELKMELNAMKQEWNSADECIGWINTQPDPKLELLGVVETSLDNGNSFVLDLIKAYFECESMGEYAEVATDSPRG